MENINVQVYSLVSEPISPIEKLKTIAKLGFAGAEFTADFTEVPVEEMKKVLAENNLKVDSAHVGLDQIEGVLPYFAELGAKLVICPATNFCNKADLKKLQQNSTASATLRSSTASRSATTTTPTSSMWTRASIFMTGSSMHVTRKLRLSSLTAAGAAQQA